MRSGTASATPPPGLVDAKAVADLYADHENCGLGDVDHHLDNVDVAEFARAASVLRVPPQ